MTFFALIGIYTSRCDCWVRALWTVFFRKAASPALCMNLFPFSGLRDGLNTLLTWLFGVYNVG